MGLISFLFITAVLYVKSVDSSGCNAYTGAVIRQYDFDYLSDPFNGNALSNNEHTPTSHTQLEVVLDPSDYSTSCACGIITMWQFFAWHPGTVVFYVLDGTTVKGTSSFTIGAQTEFNFLEIPLSSDMWIPVRSGYKLGFFTEGEPMITYESTTGGHSNGYYNTGQTLQNANTGSVQGSGTQTTSRKYAVAAYIISAHPPMFVNAPFETTFYTHDTGNVVYTARVLDLDGTDILTVTKTSGNANFVFDPSQLTLTFASTLSQNTYTVNLQVSDGCNAAVTESITLNLINEGPSFANLPASTTVAEADTATSTLFTLTATDASGDDVTCSLDSMNPSGPFSLSRVSSGIYNIRQSSPSYSYTSEKYYDLRISCTDTVTTVYTNFQVDVVKNEPPFYNTGAGYLPASVSVERTSGVTIYTLDFEDPESDTISISHSCSGSCPFNVLSSGAVSTTSVLGEEGYDLEITIDDGRNTVGPYKLSVVTSGRPYTFNSAPLPVNIPTTIYVVEHTAINAFLFKVMYTDENPSDTFTLAKDSVSNANVDTYFDFDTTTGVISVKADIDFETTGSGGWEMGISINDGSETQHETATGTVTFTIVNINEGVTLTIGTSTLTADESPDRTSVTSPFTDPGISSTDIDTGDTAYYTMDCGTNSKYFYLDTSALRVHFAREYDMDSGLPGTATCTVTVRDEKGLSDSGTMTLTVNNINDHYPKFPHNHYVFLVTTATPFFTELADMAASDADSDAFGSTNGVLTYSFLPANPTETYFQIDSAGVLYVRNVTTYTANNYVFEIVAEDSGGFTGTCTVTVIFSGTAVVTTTTTERALIFTDDYKNYFWLLLCAAGVFATIAVIALMIWKDPVVNDYISYKMLKLCEWCRKKPKVREPRRHVGKLRVTVNKKELENDPDNALPWELLTKERDVPEINEVQEVINDRIEKKDRDYKNFSGLAVFEKGKGARPESAQTTDTSASKLDRQGNDSPQYATLKSTDGHFAEEVDDFDDPWGDVTETRVYIKPAVRANENKS